MLCKCSRRVTFIDVVMHGEVPWHGIGPARSSGCGLVTCAPTRLCLADGAQQQQSAPKRWELFPDELAEEQVHRLVAGGAEVQPV